MGILLYKNLIIDYEETVHCDILGSYDIILTREIYDSIEEEHWEEYIEEEWINVEEDHVTIRMADVQIEILYLLLDPKGKEVEIKIEGLGNIYWVLHDLLHAEEDIDWVQNRQTIPSYIEVQRLIDAIPLLEKEGGCLTYEEIIEILESAKPRLDNEDFYKYKSKLEEHLEEEIYE